MPSKHTSSLVRLVMLAGSLSTAADAAPPPPDPHLHVDQFGYRPSMTKVAVLSEPVIGFDAPSPYTPSSTIEVRRWADETVAWSGSPTSWNSGAVHAQSGDRVWWLDFTALTEVGSFYLFDPVLGLGSGKFEIDDDVYAMVVREATRSFFYQRCGLDKAAPFAEPSWADSACHLGVEQDLDCRAVLDPQQATSLDLSGGWHDAGDYNKYVNFADLVVHMLLDAYEIAPAAFGDDLDLPESGNCISDLLDELRHELDWLMRMQRPDGSVLHKVSVTDFAAGSPPSTDVAPRRYAPATASATISASGALAHAATVYRAVGHPVLAAYADQLEAAARAAWAWLEANPGQIPSSYPNVGFQNVPAEDDAYQQASNRTCAAVHLFELTGEIPFRDYVDATYIDVHLLQWVFAYPFEPEYQDCLLRYSALPLATPAVANDIQTAYVTSIRSGANLGQWLTQADAYRAYLDDVNYTWGSNGTKAQQGSMYANMLRYGLDPMSQLDYRDASASYLHYLHGVNPFGLAYLSAMDGRGAERSVTTFYHSWFSDGTPWDEVGVSTFGPAPGFVPGGPNPSFRPDAAYTGPPIEPPQNQPIQKSYGQWNTEWPQNSWEVTENAIGYQAAYLKLLATVAADRWTPTPPASPGNSLRAVRQAGDVQLSWTSTAGAQWYEARRCDATGGSCSPTMFASPTVTTITDTPSEAITWYTVAAANGCGVTP